MIDREKVFIGLECCLANRHNNCPYKSTDEGIDKVTSCTTYLMKDALALLKKQEPKRGRWVFNDKKGLFDCADCGISSHYQYNFCPHCGADMREGGETDG